jgi:hypothetical protein
MAVEIPTNGGFGERVYLEGADAKRFIDEVEQPSTVGRRLRHLARSDKVFEAVFSPEPIRDLPANE